MNVICLNQFRQKKEIQLLERRMGELAQQHHGVVREMKNTFREWLLLSNSRK